MPQPIDACKCVVEARKIWLLMLQCLVAFMTRHLFQTSFVLPIWVCVWEGVGIGCIVMLIWSILHSTEAVHGQKTVWKLHARMVLVTHHMVTTARNECSWSNKLSLHLNKSILQNTSSLCLVSINVFDVGWLSFVMKSGGHEVLLSSSVVDRIFVLTSTWFIRRNWYTKIVFVQTGCQLNTP